MLLNNYYLSKTEYTRIVCSSYITFYLWFYVKSTVVLSLSIEIFAWEQSIKENNAAFFYSDVFIFAEWSLAGE